MPPLLPTARHHDSHHDLDIAIDRFGSVQTCAGARPIILILWIGFDDPDRDEEVEMYGSSGFGWIWFLWIGVAFLMFSSIGNWGYTYRAHRRFGAVSKGAIDILDERYARGEIAADEYGRMKSDIAVNRR